MIFACVHRLGPLHSGLLSLAVGVALFAAPAAAQEATPDTATASTTLDPRDRIFFSSETESIRPLAIKLVRNTLLDQKEIWTSPFHMSRSDAKWWIIFGAAAGSLMAVDYKLSRQLPNSKDQVNFSSHVSELGATYTVYPFAAGFYIFGALRDDPKARETGILSFEAIGDSLIVVEALKLATSRERPLEGSGHGHFFRAGNDSFPSGHSIQTWAAAAVIAHEYRGHKFVPVLVYGLSTLVSASRFSARKHWASDIVAGSAMGWFIGDFVVRTHENHALHQNHPSTRKSLLAPRISPHIGGGEYALALDWGR